MGTGALDLEKQFAFYGAYHSNKINILIHTLFVWPIFFFALFLLAFTPSLASLPSSATVFPFHQYMVLNWSVVLALVYAVYYLLLDYKAGSLAAAMCLGCWIGSNALAQTIGLSLGWKVGVASQIICWTGQFLGHGLFERRAPALLDNLAQAFLMAPFFVLLEVLQTLIGYEPYPGFREKVQAIVKENITEFKSGGQKKAT